jgi:hypothetical protein
MDTIVETLMLASETMASAVETSHRSANLDLVAVVGALAALNASVQGVALAIMETTHGSA